MSTKRNRDGSPKPMKNKQRTRSVERGSPSTNHKRASSDVSPSGRLLPNHNLPNIDGENDVMDMSPLKRLQRLKQNGSLRLTPKGRNSKRTLNFPADVQRNISGSDTSLSDRERRISSESDLSAEGSPVIGGGAPFMKSCVKGSNGTDSKNGSSKNVRFEDTSNGNTCSEVKTDSNGNVSTDCVLDKGKGNLNVKSDKNSSELDIPPELPKCPPPCWDRVVVSAKTETAEVNDVDSETGELKLESGASDPQCTCNEKPSKPAVPSKPPNLQRLKSKPNSVPNNRNSTDPPISPQQVVEKPKPIAVISAQSNGDVSVSGRTEIRKDKDNVVTVNYTTVAKPVIEVKLIQRRATKSQTPSPSLKHSTQTGLVSIRHKRDESGKLLSRSVDELDRSGEGELTPTRPGSDGGEEPEEPADIYACPTSFLRDPNSKIRHSFIDRNLTEKERQAIYNSVGDVQTMLRNSFTSEDEKIYSLPQPACYGDNTLKAVKKITEKYDTLQRRKLRALSFKEGDKYSGAGASFSQPSSPVSPTELSGIQPPPPPSSPPPPFLSSEKGSLSLDLTDGGERLGMGRLSGRSPEPPAPPPRWSTPVPSPTPSPPGPQRTTVTPRDTARLDLFYRGRDTEVMVCQCLAELRFGTTTHSGSTEVSDWTPIVHTGVPLLVLNTGKGKRRRELLITVAERETGFPLWSDKINYLSNYREETNEDTTSHVTQLSNNLKKVAGLTFHCAAAAKDFIEKFQEITKNPHDDLWKVSSDGDNSKKKKKRRPFSFKRNKPKRPGKADISIPCNFSHITSIDPQDRVLYDSLSDVSCQLSKSLPNSPTSSRPVSFAS